MLNFRLTLKIFSFYQLKEILILLYFSKYIVLFKSINMEVKKIKIIKNWPKLKSIYNISIFLYFTNFY